MARAGRYRILSPLASELFLHDMPSDELIAVLCTAPVADAERIANAIIETRCGACVNVLRGVSSIYRWQGAIERADEALLIIKTTRERFEALKDTIVKIHPYSTPEIIALPIVAGAEFYLRWVKTETQPSPKG